MTYLEATGILATDKDIFSSYMDLENRKLHTQLIQDLHNRKAHLQQGPRQQVKTYAVATGNLATA